MISSKDNAKVKFLMRVKRRKEDFLFLEGERIIKDAMDFTSPIEIFIREDVENTFEGLNVNTLSYKLFNEISDTINSQGMIGIFPRPNYEREDLFNYNRIYYLDRVKDPGNLGTIIRSALAFGVEALILRKGSCDPYMPKVIRATMGAIFKIPIYFDEDFDIISEWKDRGGRVYSTYLKDGKEISSMDFKEPYMIVMGNEASGVSDEIIEMSDENFYIPMQGEMESLNVAVSTSIIMYLLGGGRNG